MKTFLLGRGLVGYVVPFDALFLTVQTIDGIQLGKRVQREVLRVQGVLAIAFPMHDQNALIT